MLPSVWLPTALTVSLTLVQPAWADVYNMVKEYAGPSFFNDWVFFDHFDNLTNGDVIFVSAAEAASQQLAFVDPTTNHAIIKVDNTSTVPFNQKRNTVRISSSDLYGVGSVWTADILHVPFGCSVWPAWWSQAPGWPVGGEIDTFEGVNLQTNNQMSLHTLPGCMQVNPVQSSQMIVSNDCSNTTNGNQGCITVDPRTTSFGAPFAQNGGGLFVTEMAAAGVSIWFFPRANIPSVFTTNASTLDTSQLGPPVANYPSSPGCSSSEFFGPQELIFDITLCGDFAGNSAIFNQTCTGVCYPDWVVGNGSDYANAFFEIASVHVFGLPGTQTVFPGSNTTTSAGGGSPTSGSGGSGGNGSSTGGASRMDPLNILTVLTAILGVIVSTDYLLFSA